MDAPPDTGAGAPEFNEGYLCYLSGIKGCPYQSRKGMNWQRYHWWCGWLESRWDARKSPKES